MPYNDTFGGGVAQPSDVSYRAITLTADITLAWPTLSQTATDVAARIMGVTPSGAGLAITLPDARQVSTGQDALIRNLGASTFTIKDNAGNTIGTVVTGAAQYFYLTSNATAAGSWATVTFGTGTSSADAATLAGYGLKAIGITLNQAHVVAELSADLTVSAADRAKAYVWTVGSWAVTLPTAASVGTDFFFIGKNSGTGTITYTPSGADTIDGASSLQQSPGDGCIFYSAGGSNKWYTVGLGRSVAFSFTQLIKSVAGGSNVTLTAAECANKLLTFTGLLTASINVIVTNTVGVYYVYNNTTGPFTLTVKTAAGTGVVVAQGTRDILACDGTNVYEANSNTVSTVYFGDGSRSLPSISFILDTDTGMYRVGTDQMAVVAGGFDVMRWNTVAVAVNAIDVFPSVTGSPPILAAYGTDADINLKLAPKGTGTVVAPHYNYAQVGGTVDAMTVTLAGVTLVNGLELNLQSLGANTLTTPTINLNGGGGVTVVKGSNTALAIGDIPGADYHMTVVYDSSLTKYVLKNPYFNPTKERGFAIAMAVALG